MKQKWVYPLMITFLAFFVLSNPQTAGPQARSFFGWLGDQAAAAGTFLDGLFDDTPNGGPGGGITPTTFGNNGATSDSFNTLQPLGAGSSTQA